MSKFINIGESNLKLLRKCGATDEVLTFVDTMREIQRGEEAALRADLAKAQARCAELEREARNLYDFARGVVDGDVLRRNHQHDFWLEQRDRLKVVLASDGTSALAAVRLAQRLAKMVTPPKERPADLGLNRREKLALEVEAALTEAFGSGE